MNTRTLKIDISSYWHAGTGAGQGSLLDAIVQRDPIGLPYLPGRTLKGLLRDAVHCWESYGAYTQPQVTDQLFGVLGTDGNTTTPGILRIGSARLDNAFIHEIQQAYMNTGTQQQAKQLISCLYHQHYNTKIDAQTGTAEDKSLRSMELTVPLTLYADIRLIENTQTSLLPHAFDLLSQAFPMVKAVGKLKNRGLGRAHLEWN